MTTRTAHRLNVVGPFYVEDGCCTACGVPEHEAPGLFAWDEADHCYVSKQPTNAEELSGMISAIGCAELGCIRYRGHDPEVLRALASIGESDKCDQMADASTQPRPGRWWKAFAVGAVLWLAASIALLFDDPSLVSVATIADLVLSSFYLFALIGYAFQRAFLSRNLWRAAVPLSPIWDVVYPTLLMPEPPPVASQAILTVVVVLFVTVAIAKYVALFRYAYRSRDLWTLGVRS